MAAGEITEGVTEQVTYMKSKRGTTTKETNLEEIARLKGLGWTEVTTDEGMAAFAEKTRVAKKVLGPMEEAAKNIAVGNAEVTPVTHV